MTTKAEDLIAAIITNIGAHANVDAAKVFRNRVQAVNDDELPAYMVSLGPDEVVSEFGANNLANIDWDIAIFVDLHLRAITGQEIDSLFLDMRDNVHQALLADYTQGLDFVIMGFPLGADNPEIDNEGDKFTAVYRTNWQFRIRTDYSTIS